MANFTYLKERNPELQCPRCKGTGSIKEITNLATFTGTKTTEGPCEDCNGTGRDPAKVTHNIELTTGEIDHVIQALACLKDSVGETPEDDTKREIWNRLYERFLQLSK